MNSSPVNQADEAVTAYGDTYTVVVIL